MYQPPRREAVEAEAEAVHRLDDGMALVKV